MKQLDPNGTLSSSYFGKVEDLIRDIKYGSVTIIIQDGKIIQIDKTEKYRIKN